MAQMPAQAIVPPSGDSSDGAVSNSGAGGMPNQSGVLPPSANPTPQNVPPQGNEALGMEVMRKITGGLHYARMLFGPGSEMLKVVDKLYRDASKHFQPDSDVMKGGKMPPLQSVGRGQPQGGPPMAGAGAGAMPPPSPPRGPIPMPAQGGIV